MMYSKEGSTLKIKPVPPLFVTSYNVKYQGQERQDEFGLNWDSFKWRNYDFAIGRFFNVDPLSEEYSYQSHYNFSENRVIDGRELEGLEWKSIKNEDGSSTRQFTVQLVNNSSLSEKQMSKLITKMQTDFKETYSGEGSNAQLIVQPVSSVDNDCDYPVTIINTESTILYNDEGEIVGKTYDGGETPMKSFGQTQKGNFNVIGSVDGVARSFSDISRSFSHEAGHGAGLLHPWSANNKISDIKQGGEKVKNSTVRSNIMNSDQNPIEGNRSTSGTETTPGQLQSIDILIKEQTKIN